MASYSFGGNSYYFVKDKWLDCNSQPVKREIAIALNNRFSKNGIVPVAAVKKKPASKYAVGGLTDKPKNTYANNVPASSSKKAKKKKKSVNDISSLFPKDARETKKKSNYYHKKARAMTFQKNVVLTKDQSRALALLESGKNVFLSGEAGTGKSFVLNEFIRRNQNKNIIVCAPTGIAAINVGGSTLHRVFKIPVGVSKPNDYNNVPSDAVINADIIVIDEISMCRFDLFEFVVRTIKCAEMLKQKKDNEEAVSNGSELKINDSKQIIVVGDFYQLAPVINTKDKDILFDYWDREKYSSGFAFQSDLWKDLDFKSVVLKEIVRQKGDEEFISNLNKIRTGDRSGIAWFNTHVSKESISNGINICGTNREADGINEKESAALKSREMSYTAKSSGQVTEGDKMTADTLTLKVGMQVMTLVNNVEEGYQNGSIGKVTALYNDKAEVLLNNGRSVTVAPYKWEIAGYEIQNDKLEKIVLGDFEQLPIKIAYAITIHKSQGQTYSSVNILPNCFADGQLYVALSRAQSIAGMSIAYNIPTSSLKTSLAVKAFYENLLEEKESVSNVVEQLSYEKDTDSENVENYSTDEMWDALTSGSYFDLPIETTVEDIVEEKEIDYENEEVEETEEDLLERLTQNVNKFNVHESDMNRDYEHAYRSTVLSMSDEEIESCTMYKAMKNNASAYAGWTVEEERQLIDEVAKGMSVKEIAAIHQRTRGAIRSRIKKINER